MLETNKLDDKDKENQDEEMEEAVVVDENQKNWYEKNQEESTVTN